MAQSHLPGLLDRSELKPPPCTAFIEQALLHTLSQDVFAAANKHA